MFGVWWAGAEPDVKDVGAGAKGYSALALNPNGGRATRKVQDILKKVHDKGQGSARATRSARCSTYPRHDHRRCWASRPSARRRRSSARARSVTGEQVRWGFENLNLDEARLEELGFEGVIRPVKTTCEDHMGSSWARVTPGTAASG
jgi:branched-chain amino acid transport system substrate-binding protein